MQEKLEESLLHRAGGFCKLLKPCCTVQQAKKYTFLLYPNNLLKFIPNWLLPLTVADCG
jgi:hypothetical protein